MTRRQLTAHERVFIIKRYFSTGSYKNIQEEWSNSFSTATPTKSTMFALINKFNTTGSTADAPRSGRPISVTTEENRQLVQGAFSASPKKLARRASIELEISDRSIRRMLQALGMKPYKPNLLHALNEDDPDRRLQFCKTFLQFYENSAEIADQIIWSDEVTFKVNGHVNRHNSVYWYETNPREILEKEVNVPGITVWGGISSSGMIGPFFFEETVTGNSYLTMLQEKMWPVVSQRQDIDQIYFQQDGAPPHYSTEVRNWLDDHFPNRWIGRRGPIERPARSPDMSPPEFFLWGVLTDAVYRHKPKTNSQLKQCIEEEWQKLQLKLAQKYAEVSFVVAGTVLQPKDIILNICIK